MIKIKKLICGTSMLHVIISGSSNDEILMFIQVIQVWFQNRRSKEKRDASYRDALKDEPRVQSTPQIAGSGMSHDVNAYYI